MAKLNLEDFYDLHIHSYPSLMDRIGDDVEIAKICRNAGMKAIMFKSHHESTVSRAYHTAKQVPGIDVFGGIVLNNAVGGLNPVAVEVALRLGAKQVWMPTVDSLEHSKVHGLTGKTGYQGAISIVESKEITIFDNGEVDKNIPIIIKLAKQYNAILGTSHLSEKEIYELVKLANKLRLRKILITHPFWKPPFLSIKAMKEIVDIGAILEFCAGTVYPVPGYGNIYNFKNAIKEIGAEHIIISSDAGKPGKSLPNESIRVFSQCLYDIGISYEELKTMMIENPGWLLYK